MKIKERKKDKRKRYRERDKEFDKEREIKIKEIDKEREIKCEIMRERDKSEIKSRGKRKMYCMYNLDILHVLVDWVELLPAESFLLEDRLESYSTNIIDVILQCHAIR